MRILSIIILMFVSSCITAQTSMLALIGGMEYELDGDEWEIDSASTVLNEYDVDYTLQEVWGEFGTEVSIAGTDYLKYSEIYPEEELKKRTSASALEELRQGLKELENSDEGVTMKFTELPDYNNYKILIIEMSDNYTEAMVSVGVRVINDYNVIAVSVMEVGHKTHEEAMQSLKYHLNRMKG